MKKFLSLFIAIIMVLTVFSSCKGAQRTDDGTEPTTPQAEKLNIVVTVFPEYSWVRALLGDLSKTADITLLLDSGVDLHSYQPTADDIVKINSCDMFVYIGGESDAWVENVLKQNANPDAQVINLISAIGDRAKNEVLLEGMEEHEHDEDHDEDHDDHDEHEEVDEHIWLSLKNAELCCDAIAKGLSAIDAENSAVYAANLESYKARLRELDAKYAQTVSSAKTKTLLFCDRYPFGYLADDYSLTCYAAFSGCSAETEASFETVSFLTSKLDELGLDNVIIIEGSSNKRLAETVISGTKAKAQKILVLNSLQSVTNVNDVDYISVMEDNLKVIAEALG